MNRPSPDDMKAMGVMEYVQELEEENKNLKEENKKLREDSKSLESAIGDVVRENRRLKAQIEKMSGIGLVSAAPTVILDD